jgi:hypothetical protein
MSAKKKWNRTWPHACDVCGASLELEPWFADAVTDGRWRLACPECCDEMGVRFGTGCGQKYDSKSLEKLEG